MAMLKPESSLLLILTLLFYYYVDCVKHIVLSLFDCLILAVFCEGLGAVELLFSSPALVDLGDNPTQNYMHLILLEPMDFNLLNSTLGCSPNVDCTWQNPLSKPQRLGSSNCCHVGTFGASYSPLGISFAEWTTHAAKDGSKWLETEWTIFQSPRQPTITSHKLQPTGFPCAEKIRIRSQNTNTKLTYLDKQLPEWKINGEFGIQSMYQVR